MTAISSIRLSTIARQTLADSIFTAKYAREGETSTIQTFQRVARGLLVNDPRATEMEPLLIDAMASFSFLPAGRILSGAGTTYNITMGNCFVMGTIPDDMKGIFEELKRSALTMQMGGGIGLDFSTLRPKGAPVKGVGADASGPITFMDTWDAMCRTIMSAGSRRGAMMATMRCDHPDIEAFIEAKREPGRLRMFNLSVLISDAFMAAVDADAEWDLVFSGQVFKTVRARDLWAKIMKSNYEFAEPGVIFIDRINNTNPLNYAEAISSTNPCGEAPLPPYGMCLLGSINLAALVSNPFTPQATLNMDALSDLMPLAVRVLDNAIDLSNYALPEQQAEAQNKRRLGIGITGLANALLMCGQRYGSTAAKAMVRTWMRAIRREAYLASADLAEERGSFLLFDRDIHIANLVKLGLDADVIEAVSTKGLRNSHLGAIAPTGTMSLICNNVSSGLEPSFNWRYLRTVLQPDGSKVEEAVYDAGYLTYCAVNGLDPDAAETLANLPEIFVTAKQLSADEHLETMAICQEFIDQSISKTTNVDRDIAFDAFQAIYRKAFDLGCKGCTTYRENDVTGSVLKEEAAPVAAPAPATPRPGDLPDVLDSTRIAVQWPGNDAKYFLNIGRVTEADGSQRPVEVFINTHSQADSEMTQAVALLMSHILRYGCRPDKALGQLKRVTGPESYFIGGKRYDGLVSLIASTIEGHMESLKGLTGSAPVGAPVMAAKSAKHGGDKCPKCDGDMVHQGGCPTCSSCGYSKCS